MEKFNQRPINNIEKTAKEETKETAGLSKKMRQLVSLTLIPFFLMGKEPVFAEDGKKESVKPSHEFSLSEKTKTLMEKIFKAGVFEQKNPEWKDEIGFELETFASIGDDIKEQAEKAGQKLPGVNFEERAVDKIIKSAEIEENVLKLIGQGKNEEADKQKEKFQEQQFGSAVLNFGKFKDTLGLYGLGLLSDLSNVIIHEIGHKNAFEKYGVSSDISVTATTPLGFSGCTSANTKEFIKIYENRNKKKKKEMIEVDSAGTRNTKKAANFLIDILKSQEGLVDDEKISPFAMQCLSLGALSTRGSSLKYVLFSLSKNDLFNKEIKQINALPDSYKDNHYLYSKKVGGNDLFNYAINTNTPLEEIYYGLTFDFLFDPDVWKTLQIAFGKQGVKFSDKTLKLSYDLAERGPQWGIQFDAKF